MQTEHTAMLAGVYLSSAKNKQTNAAYYSIVVFYHQIIIVWYVCIYYTAPWWLYGVIVRPVAYISP